MGSNHDQLKLVRKRLDLEEEVAIPESEQPFTFREFSRDTTKGHDIKSVSRLRDESIDQRDLQSAI